jgi:ferredoxin
MRYTVRIDSDNCVSSGTCVAEAPEAFVFDPDKVATSRADARPVEDDRLLQIAQNCPSGAILLFDSAGEAVDPFG